MREYREYRDRDGYRRDDRRSSSYYLPPRRGGSPEHSDPYRDNRSYRDPYRSGQGRARSGEYGMSDRGRDRYSDRGYRGDRYEYQDSGYRRGGRQSPASLEQGRRYRSGGRYDDYAYDDEYYYDYEYRHGGVRFGVILLVSLILLAAVGCGIVVFYVNRTLKTINYVPLEDLSDEVFNVSAADLMRDLPKDGLIGEELNDYHSEIYRNEILKSYYRDDELVSKNTATNILIVTGESENSPADIVVIMTIDSDRRQLTFTALMPETGIAYYDVEDPMRLACATQIDGPSMMLYTVQSLLGMRIDKYIMLDYDGLAALIDTIGGVEFEMTEQQSEKLNGFIKENSEGNINIPAGKSRLTGQQLIMLARYGAAISGSEASGMRRQLLYSTVCSLKDANAIQSYNALSQSAPHFITDIKGAQVFSLFSVYAELKKYNVIIDAVPTEGEFGFVVSNETAIMRIPKMRQCRRRFLANALGITVAEEVSGSDEPVSASDSYNPDYDPDYDPDVDGDDE